MGGCAARTSCQARARSVVTANEHVECHVIVGGQPGSSPLLPSERRDPVLPRRAEVGVRGKAAVEFEIHHSVSERPGCASKISVFADGTKERQRSASLEAWNESFPVKRPLRHQAIEVRVLPPELTIRRRDRAERIIGSERLLEDLRLLRESV